MVDKDTHFNVANSLIHIERIADYFHWDTMITGAKFDSVH